MNLFATEKTDVSDRIKKKREKEGYILKNLTKDFSCSKKDTR